MHYHRVLAGLIVISFLLSACSIGTSPSSSVTGATPPSEAPGSTASAPPAATTGSGEAATAAPNDSGVVTITFGAFEQQRAAYEPLIAAFEKDNPTIHVKFVSLDQVFGGGEPRDPLQSVLKLVDTTSFPANRDALNQGWARDLAPLMSADATFARDDFYPGALESATQDGHTYQLPRAIHIPLLFYNKDLWQKRGVPAPKPDWSWNDVTAAAEQVAQKRGDAVEVYGMIDWTADASLIGELTNAGVDLGDRSRSFEDPKFEAAIKRVADLIKSGAIYTTYGGNAPVFSGPSDFKKFFSDLIDNQQVGMWAPDLFFPGYTSPSGSFAVGAVPFPSSIFPFFSSVDGYKMSAGTQQPEAAWRWLEFLSRQDYSAPGQLPIGPSTLPSRKSVAEKSGYWTKLDPDIATVLQNMLASPAAQDLSGTNKSLFRFEAEQDLMDTVLRAAVAGTPPLAQALHQAQTEIDRQLASQPAPTANPAPFVVATPVPEAQANATKITFAAWLAADQFRALANSFNQANPGIFVDLKEPVTSGDQPPLSQLAATSDCFSWYGPLDPTAVTATLDLQPLVDADAGFQANDYPAAVLAPFRSQSGLYALPDTVYFRTLHYNKDAFDAAGVAYPSADWTLDDLVNAAQKLTSGTGDQQRYGFAATQSQTRDVFYFLDRLGASATKGSGDSLQPNFTDAKVVQAINTYLDLLRASSPHKQLQGYLRGALRDDAFALITKGQVGMWFDYSTSFIGGREAPSFGWAIAPEPLGGSALTGNDFFVRSMAISAQSPNRDACWTWMKYVSDNVSVGSGGFPARSSLVTAPAFTGQATPGAADIYNTYAAKLAGASSAAPGGVGPAIDYFWFFQAIDRALQGGNLERELADAQALTEQYLACVRSGGKNSACATTVDPQYRGRGPSSSWTP